MSSGNSRYNFQNSVVPDDFIHRSGLATGVLFLRGRNQIVKPTSLNIFLELFVPKGVKMLAQFRCKLPRFLWRQFTNRFADFSDGTHFI
jgi:hypothetical protein